ncbi:MAG: RNA-protein complex protein Nop10 [Methanosphaera sp.]|uniref:RNA-protein complex protein Nop10 n=1 Tax=Methanosphaera sp. TaxID=2666342 RepID=UPI0025D4DEF3|nr:RNA-protein complex protein Nop10 [Methanosphaera sp.]MCI5866782.1 RNA-protein complex protein Nop10 [Methanosphaera sp.]MDD6534296.1 RNA-protein complex protein Nop10 [Methanosphaera sp.]MDY3956319.1 RNA-protein complex protein Nop10 [Methanosphaera sp.]
MKFQMRRCKVCNEYTLKDVCPRCDEKTGVIFPARYSPQDKYGKYRRMMKKQQQENM